jgi:hypothetical protein
MVRKMTEWSVELQAVGDGTARLDEDGIGDLIEALSQESAAVSFLPGRYSVRLTVQASDIPAALAEATSRASGAVEKARLPLWPFVQATVLTAEEFDRELRQPALPVLLGVAELAERLGVTRQRASDLARASSFPRPITTLASGPVWAEPTVTRYIGTWTRRPGRPKTS